MNYYNDISGAAVNMHNDAPDIMRVNRGGAQNGRGQEAERKSQTFS